MESFLVALTELFKSQTLALLFFAVLAIIAVVLVFVVLMQAIALSVLIAERIVRAFGKVRRSDDRASRGFRHWVSSRWERWS